MFSMANIYLMVARSVNVSSFSKHFLSSASLTAQPDKLCASRKGTYRKNKELFGRYVAGSHYSKKAITQCKIKHLYQFISIYTSISVSTYKNIRFCTIYINISEARLKTTFLNHQNRKSTNNRLKITFTFRYTALR